MIPELDTGGAERTAVDVALALKAAGGRALVASEGGRLVAELDAAGIEHVALPLKSKSPLTMLANARRLAALVRERGIDILHARSRAPAWSALLAARLAGAAFVTTYHGSYNQRSALKGFYNSVMARGDISIANSHYIAGLMRERHGVADERLAVIHRGSDLAGFAPGSVGDERVAGLRDAWRISDGAKVLLNVGRLTGWKGQKVVLSALALLAERRPDLFGRSSPNVMVFAGGHQGREAYFEELQALVARHGLSPNIRFAGHVSDVAAAHALADFAIVASIEPEAFGRAAVEAQAAGIPVIVSDLGAVPETVLAPPDAEEADRTGWRVPPGDADALADCLATVMDLDEAETDALAARARAHVAAHFSLETMTGKTLDVYRRVMAARDR